VPHTVLFWCNNDSVNVSLMRKCEHQKKQSLHTSISNTAKPVELCDINFYCERCTSISRRLPLLQIRNVTLPFHILSPNAITNIMRLGMSLIVRPSSKVSNYLEVIYEKRLTAQNTERRQTKDGRTLRRQDVVAIWLHFAAAAYRGRQTGRTWDRTGTVRQC